MDVLRNWLDYFSVNPRDELQVAFQRTPSVDYAHGLSIAGRKVCVRKLCFHTMGIVLKPTFYFVVGGIHLLSISTLKNQEPYKSNPKAYEKDLKFAKRLFYCTFTASLGQFIQLFKAALGIVDPRAYFKEDILNQYFVKLSGLAVEVGCDEELVTLLKNGSEIIQKNMWENVSAKHYYALFEQDLRLMCDKFSQPGYPKEKIAASLAVLRPDPAEKLHTGLKSCPPGLGRLFEQIRATIDMPLEHKDLVPWLIVQFKEEVIDKMILQATSTARKPDESIMAIALDNAAKKESVTVSVRPEWHKAVDALSHEPIHRANAFIACLGAKIGLPQESIAKTAFDPTLNPITKAQEDLIITEFNRQCNESSLLSFLQTRLNSDASGDVGLKTFREYAIQQLAATVTEDQLRAAKEEIMRRFHIGTELAGEPVFFVRLKYLLYPELQPQDPKYTDLNEEGIKAFTATLLHDPLAMSRA